ncbi:MAG: methyl-accepting chemotaxis protein [Bdellovibrionota bacterium]
MPENLTSNQRRSLKRFWLNPSYQTRYVLWITLTGVFLVALQSIIFYVFTRENYEILVELSPMTDDAKLQLFEELRTIIVLLISASVIFISVMAFLGVVFSHRTVGPLYHFKRVFDDIRSGNKSARIRLRPKDDFQEVAKSFNEMMDSLSGK